jgi:hypothetical protein
MGLDEPLRLAAPALSYIAADAAHRFCNTEIMSAELPF